MHWKNTLAAPFLRSLYYNDGANDPIYYTAPNILWALLLVSCLAASIVYFRENDPIQFWLGISIVGLFLFELLFEAQSRHLYVLYRYSYCTEPLESIGC